MRFWREKDGVSVVLGTLLMFTLMVGLYASYQVTQVPIWNNQIDAQSFETTYGDFLFLKSDIRNVATLRQPKSTIIRLGTRYPDRMIFINTKQGMYGSLTKEDITGTITYTIDYTGDPTFTENIISSRLIYDTLSPEGGKIIYEHGLIILDFPNGSVSTDTQELIVGEELFIPVLDASLFTSISSMRAESFSLKPYSASRVTQNIKSVIINLPTAYPRIWADRLEGLDTDRMTVTVNQATSMITIESTAIRRINFPQYPATDATLSTGIIFFNTTTQEGFDPTTAFPNLFNVIFESVGDGNDKKTHTTITATIRNVTAPFDIHADLSSLTQEVLDYDEQPTFSSNPDMPIDAYTWDIPNETTVKWENITHPEYTTLAPLGISFWVYNSILDQRYMRTVVTFRASSNDWDN